MNHVTHPLSSGNNSIFLLEKRSKDKDGELLIKNLLDQIEF